MGAELVALPYSPWSEKARWALDHHRVEYRERTYEPVIGELALRARVWRGGRISVPVLFDGNAIFEDSTVIARHAETIGSGAPLFPAAELGTIEHWIDAGERGLDAGRALSLARVLADDEALTELLPRPLRKTGAVGRAIAAWGSRRTLRKYGGHLKAPADHERELRAVLDELRASLGGRPTLLATFSFADIAASQILQFVAPVTWKSFRIGRATRRVFGAEEVARDYADLISWRDRLYATSR